MKVFVLMQGCYSDTSVVGVFSSKEAMEKYTSAFHEDAFWEIEEDLDEPSGASLPPEGMRSFRVRIDLNGDVRDIELAYSGPNDEDDGVVATYDLDRLGCLGVACWARDEEHATKIANERRVRWMTSPEGQGRLIARASRSGGR